MLACTATTRAGRPCRNRPMASSGTCHAHSPPRPGRLYVLSNKHIAGLKIGMTTGRASDRARALSGTGSPIPFVVELETEAFDGCAAAEKAVFADLAAGRVAPNREFFAVSVTDAVAAVRRAVAASTSAPGPPEPPPGFRDGGRSVTVAVPPGVDEVTIRFARAEIAGP
jgi:hypothetical protein